MNLTSDSVLLDYLPPSTVGVEIPSAVNAVQALGYQSFAALGDALINPHQWRLQFPLILHPSVKQFLANIIYHAGLPRPLAIWVIATSPDLQEYTHFVAPITVISEITLTVSGTEPGSLSLTLSSPFTHTEQNTEQTPSDQFQLPVMYRPAINVRGLTIRDLTVGETEVLSISITSRRQVSWHWTSLAPDQPSIARRAPTMFTVTPITLEGNITLGYPFSFSHLQSSFIHPMTDLRILIRDIATINLIGLKFTSWRQDFSANRVSITVNFSALNWFIT
jgi:hypothetical protein